MSHPAASIKSIYSGEVNFDSIDDLDHLQYNQLKNHSFEDDVSSRISHDSSYSNGRFSAVNSNLAYEERFNGNHHTRSASSSSVISTEYSSSKLPNTSKSDLVSSPKNEYPQSPGESISRPLSRNSNTSCLSVTATKDGIEGKKFHRTGPSPYSTKLIANMMLSQQQQQALQQQPQPQPMTPSKLAKLNLANSRGTEFPKPINADYNASQASFRTTDSEVDGETGAAENRATLFDKSLVNDSMLPPVTLNEKINLLSTDVLES